MEAEYLIMDISDGRDHTYGKIVIVRANPVRNTVGVKFVAQHLCDDTELFFFPDDDNIVEPILRIARGQGLWTPDDSDFVEEKIYSEDNCEQEAIYRHVSFFSDVYDHSFNSGKTPKLINNELYKAFQLKERYYLNGWRESMGLKEYVESLAVGDGAFWGWLFGDNSLNGLMPWELPGDCQCAYEDFLDSFEEKGE